MNELTTERLNEIIADTGRPKMHWADCTERYRMALELKAKREECEALQRERDESRDLIASAMHDVGERSFLEDAQRILRGCVAPYSCEQMKAVADALRQWRDKWAILLEMLVRSNEERDAARAEAEKLRAELAAVKRQRDELVQAVRPVLDKIDPKPSPFQPLLQALVAAVQSASQTVQQPKPALSFNGVPIHLENSFLADELPKPEGGAS